MAEKKEFPTAPPGPQMIVFADYEKLGYKQVRYKDGTKNLLRIALFFLSEYKDDGQPISIRQEFNESYGPSSRLRRFLDSWSGKTMSDATAKNFDWERLIGVNGWANIVHNVTPGRTYANIGSIMPPPPGREKLLIPRDFTRKKDRVQTEAPVPDDTEAEEWPFN